MSETSIFLAPSTTFWEGKAKKYTTKQMAPREHNFMAVVNLEERLLADKEIV